MHEPASNGRGIMQLSTTSMTTVVSPSASASARAFSGVFTLSTVRLTMLPLTMTGRVFGVTSTTVAAARNPFVGWASSRPDSRERRGRNSRKRMNKGR